MRVKSLWRVFLCPAAVLSAALVEAVEVGDLYRVSSPEERGKTLYYLNNGFSRDGRTLAYFRDLKSGERLGFRSTSIPNAFPALDVSLRGYPWGASGPEEGAWSPDSKRYYMNFGTYYVEINGLAVQTLGGAQFGAQNGAALADLDSLGYSTLYVILADGTSPALKAAAYVQVLTPYASGVIGEASYLVTTIRDVGGVTDESGPSAVGTITGLNGEAVTVSRPTLPALATHWRVYRTGADGTYQLVAQVAAATATYRDETLAADLGETPPGWFTSALGNDIAYSPPPGEVDGLLQETYGGMLFAWVGSELLWCEPGKPDAWPSFYSLNLPGTVQAASNWEIAPLIWVLFGELFIDIRAESRLVRNDHISIIKYGTARYNLMDDLREENHLLNSKIWDRNVYMHIRSMCNWRCITGAVPCSLY